MNRLDNSRNIRAARGGTLSARSWLTEAPLRMLMNNLDREVAERPEELVVYGGIGRAARDWNAFDRIVETLRRLEAEEALLHHLLGAPGVQVATFSPLLAVFDAHPPVKVIAFNHGIPGDIDLLPEYQRRFPTLSITRTHEWLVETTAAGVDKGSGLRRLCDLLGLDIRRVMAIGDSDNDIPMLEAAGLGVAMGNAGEHVKAVAGWVAPTIDEEGAAVAMQRWILDA